MFRHMRAFLLTEKAVKHMVQFMNKLARDKRIQIISLLVEGMSLRAITRARHELDRLRSVDLRRDGQGRARRCWRCVDVDGNRRRHEADPVLAGWGPQRRHG